MKKSQDRDPGSWRQLASINGTRFRTKKKIKIKKNTEKQKKERNSTKVRLPDLSTSLVFEVLGFIYILLLDNWVPRKLIRIIFFLKSVILKMILEFR